METARIDVPEDWRALADRLAGSVWELVLGAAARGKSAFCRFLAQRLASDGIARTMPRDVTDPTTATTWTCAQAFAGLGGGSSADTAERAAEAARVQGSGDRFRVVCTPSGGALSVRLELPGDWEAALPDEALLAAIRAELAESE